MPTINLLLIVFLGMNRLPCPRLLNDYLTEWDRAKVGRILTLQLPLVGKIFLLEAKQRLIRLTGLLYRKRTILEHSPTMWSSSTVVACTSFGLLLLVVFLIGRICYRRREKLTMECKADDYFYPGPQKYNELLRSTSDERPVYFTNGGVSAESYSPVSVVDIEHGTCFPAGIRSSLPWTPSDQSNTHKDENVPPTAKGIFYINFQWEMHQVILNSAKGLQSLGDSERDPHLILLRLRVRLEKHLDAKKRMLFEHNAVHRKCKSTLVIALALLGIFLLLAVLIYRRRRCRKLTDIESRTLHTAMMLPVEDWKNVEKQAMKMAVEDDLPLA
ncbi:hypothetical protein F5146DRAFT_1005430 [Armillaria mellea]|nr:hypothetical protein F5146DRAFT_1005430 [Armillaria mellea]